MKPIFSSRDWQKDFKKNTFLHRFFRVIAQWYDKHITPLLHTKTPSPHQHSVHYNAPPAQEQNRTAPQRFLQKIMTRPFKKRPTHKNTPKDPRRWRRIFAVIMRWILILALVGFIALVGVFIYFSKDLPEPGKVNTRFIAESTKIYDRTGEVLLYDVHGEEKRTIIPFDEMPQSIKDATIALEDRDFYHHHGIRLKAIARAFLSRVFHIGTPSGGSTITQQLVKNSILTNERSITRKIKEAILAIEIELKFSKDEILGMYLNEIPYGSNAYGVEAAAQTFFNKHAKDLTYAEAAMLAALPQAPSRYSPYGSHRDLLKGRQEYALDQMRALGFINEQQATDAKSVDIFSTLNQSKENINAPHFVFYILDQIEETYGKDYLKENGLTIITTLDWEKQQLAEKIVKEHALTNTKAYNAENAALVAIDSHTGEILTMVGSRDYFDKDIDGNVNVALAKRQPGSSFKPYIYLLSFIKGYTPETILYDVETDFPILDQGRDYTPQNYSGTFHGPLKIKEALGQSLNIPAVKALYLVGIPDTISFVKDLGITTLDDPERYGLALVLGGGEVRLLDHVAGFSVFANNGIKHKKYAIKEIRDKNGATLQINQKDDGERLIDEKYIAMLSHILSTNKYRAPAFGENNPLRFDDRPVAAKTGTTNENRDAWTIGYTPDVAVGVWAGNNDNRRMNGRGVGANAAAPIFRDFILQAYPNPSQQSFPTYKKEKTNKDILDGEIKENKKRKVCQISKKKNKYCLINKFCPDDRIKKRVVIETHNILHYVKKDDPRGEEPDDPEKDPYYKPWDRGVVNHYSENEKKAIFASDLEECQRDDFDDYTPDISIDTLRVSGKELEVGIKTDTPFDVDEIMYRINGDTIKTTKDKKIRYTIPDNLNHTTLTVSVVLRDVVGNSAEDSKEISVAF